MIEYLPAALCVIWLILVFVDLRLQKQTDTLLRRVEMLLYRVEKMQAGKQEHK